MAVYALAPATAARAGTAPTGETTETAHVATTETTAARVWPRHVRRRVPGSAIALL
jgi:hypothetical protein